MASNETVDFAVIGAGAAGLTAASIASQLGLRVTLIERDRMGGECLYTGCVPSKSLLAAANAVHTIRQASAFGIDATPVVDYEKVRAHVRSVIDAIAPHDSPERFTQLGVDVRHGDARFVGPRRIRVGDDEIVARRCIVATGARPAIPAIPGIDSVTYLTNETIFDLPQRPRRLILLGGGAVGVELAQAFVRLGTEVAIVESDVALSNEDPELARTVLARLQAEGVTLLEHARAARVSSKPGSVAVEVEQDSRVMLLEGSHLLVATGRAPRVQDLGLEAAGVRCDRHGIAVDAFLRTTERHTYAAGDVVPGPRFTHVAGYQAALAVRNAIVPLRSRIDYSALPWVTYTDPELAQIGLTETQARERHGDRVRVVCVAFADNDRARIERQADGRVKLIAARNGSVLGVSIVGAHAGEIAGWWALAMHSRVRLRSAARTIVPYPTFNDLGRTAAADFYKPLLRGTLPQRIAHWLTRLP
jgi:pyruvate/2-oxoglutarate dehydrogenase complex dihydrolipoamide dehydrogenase (E3) component